MSNQYTQIWKFRYNKMQLHIPVKIFVGEQARVGKFAVDSPVHSVRSALFPTETSEERRVRLLHKGIEVNQSFTLLQLLPTGSTTTAETTLVLHASIGEPGSAIAYAQSRSQTAAPPRQPNVDFGARYQPDRSSQPSTTSTATPSGAPATNDHIELPNGIKLSASSFTCVISLSALAMLWFFVLTRASLRSAMTFILLAVCSYIWFVIYREAAVNTAAKLSAFFASPAVPRRTGTSTR
jgi:hypothetical protein